MVALYSQKIKAIEFLVAAGADVHAKDYHGCSPLSIARTQGNPKTFSLLLNAKVIDVNAQDDEGYTLLHSAVWEAQLEIIELLIKAGACMFIKNNKGYSPYDLAILKGNDNVLRALWGPIPITEQNGLFSKATNPTPVNAVETKKCGFTNSN